MMTYSNAMPRLASANVHHSKQLRNGGSSYVVGSQGSGLVRGFSGVPGHHAKSGIDGKEIRMSVLSHKRVASKGNTGNGVAEQKRVLSGVVSSNGTS